MDNCKLCGEEKKLCNSHIIPEFFFKPTYDEKHQGTVLQLMPNKKFFIQKGYREKLFCKDCEGKFSKYEDYVAKKWYQNNTIPKRTSQDVIIIEGLDYKLFKLFHLSILFRASVSTKSEYEYIDPGPHENKIKKLLLADNPGPKNRYTFFGLYLVHEANLLNGFIMQPLPSKLDSHRVYVFFFGGVQWNYVVSSHTPQDYLDIVYTGGDLILAREKFTENKFVKDFAQQYNQSTYQAESS